LPVITILTDDRMCVIDLLRHRKTSCPLLESAGASHGCVAVGPASVQVFETSDSQKSAFICVDGANGAATKSVDFCYFA
jgi:hypothetical protein